jgi:hypothetical protein
MRAKRNIGTDGSQIEYPRNLLLFYLLILVKCSIIEIVIFEGYHYCRDAAIAFSKQY